MPNHKTFIRPLAVVALLTAAGAAQATITVYTSLASFTAAVQNPGTDTFQGIDRTIRTFGPLNRVAGDYGYVATTLPNNSFFGAGTSGDTWLSTDIAQDKMVFADFTGGVSAVGGLFFGSNISGGFASGDIKVSASDADGVVSQTLFGATTGSFLGFVSSTGALTSATVQAVQPIELGFLWPTVDNLVLATAVPEPGSYALLLAGLGIVGVVTRRRRGEFGTLLLGSLGSGSLGSGLESEYLPSDALPPADGIGASVGSSSPSQGRRPHDRARARTPVA